MPPTDSAMVRILVPTIAALGFMVIALTAVNAVTAMAHVRPYIGDIISFPARANQAGADQAGAYQAAEQAGAEQAGADQRGMSEVAPGQMWAGQIWVDQIALDGGRLIVHRSGQFGCVLDRNVLRHFGGSLVVEGEMPGAAGKFRVHWAGERTSVDTADCGADADLILDGQELDILALSAGGYGTGQKRLPVFVNSSPG